MSRNTGPNQATVQLVRGRDGYACVRCGATAFASHILSTQHRQARGMGGTSRPEINSVANLLTVCGTGTTGCHGWIEAHPSEAREHGWAVPSWDTPADIPVWTWRGWLLLNSDGGIEYLPDHDLETACGSGCHHGAAS